MIKTIAWLALVGLLAMLVVWIASNTYWDDVSVPMPLQGEAARNPFYAAQRFAEALGARTQWDRDFVAPGSEAVVIVSYWNWGLTAARREQMERWVESGGRLVVDRSLISGSDEFERWSGIRRLEPEPSEDGGETDGAAADAGSAAATGMQLPCRTYLVEAGPADADVDNYSICGVDRARPLVGGNRAVWAVGDRSGLHALRVNLGRGSVTAINATPFLYRELLDADHAALLVAAAQLRSGDVIHFLSERDHESLLALTWRHGWPVVALVLASIALGLWRGSARFGPLMAAPEAARRSLAEQIRGTGRFAMRFGRGKALHAAAARALREAASRRIAAYGRLSSAERAELLASATGLDAKRLAAALDHNGAHGSKELGTAIALLESARRRISMENRRTKRGTT